MMVVQLCGFSKPLNCTLEMSETVAVNDISRKC
jgi:hypothetical protein